jgi:hypothetical protein
MVYISFIIISLLLAPSQAITRRSIGPKRIRRDDASCPGTLETVLFTSLHLFQGGRDTQ